METKWIFLCGRATCPGGVSHYTAMQLYERENKNEIAVMVHNQEIKQIYNKLMQQISAEKRKDMIKDFIKKI